MTHPDPAPPDNTRWWLGVLVDLARRLIGHAVKRYPDLAAKHTCPRCGHRA